MLAGALATVASAASSSKHSCGVSRAAGRHLGSRGRKCRFCRLRDPMAGCMSRAASERRGRAVDGPTVVCCREEVDVVRIGVQGSGGVLGRAVVARAGALGDTVVTADDSVTGVDVLVRASPPATWQRAGVPSIAPAVRQADAAGAPVDVAAAGWWGGLGTLLAGVAVAEADDPRALHVAYGLPGTRRALARASATLRRQLLAAATEDAAARVDGEVVAEPLGEGRRLAWFPQPVGPAHAVAVGGLEQHAPLAVPTVRTWFAAGAMTAELLQAVGRLRTDRGIGAWLDRRMAEGGSAEGTADVRWAVVVEARDGDGTVVRAWANGTDPVAAAADLLVLGARRLSGLAVPPASGTVLDLGPPGALLDDLADLRTLRWSVSRPAPSAR